jgi:hypothetical protein
VSEVFGVFEYVLTFSFQSRPMCGFYGGVPSLLCDEICDLTSSHKVGRIMMNIRGLIMDDPEHTVHLQTIQFTTRTNLCAEIEDE